MQVRIGLSVQVLLLDSSSTKIENDCNTELVNLSQEELTSFLQTTNSAHNCYFGLN